LGIETTDVNNYRLLEVFKMLIIAYRSLAEHCNKTTHGLCENSAGVAALNYDGGTFGRPHRRFNHRMLCWSAQNVIAARKYEVVIVRDVLTYDSSQC